MSTYRRNLISTFEPALTYMFVQSFTIRGLNSHDWNITNRFVVSYRLCLKIDLIYILMQNIIIKVSVGGR
jgi:hypothetical protein